MRESILIGLLPRRKCDLHPLGPGPRCAIKETGEGMVESMENRLGAMAFGFNLITH